MYLIHANVWYERDKQSPGYSVWTSPDAERLGVLSVNSVVPLHRVVADLTDVDAHVATALACASLGSRLLRLAGTIGSQRPLFTMDVLERSE